MSDVRWSSRWDYILSYTPQSQMQFLSMMCPLCLALFLFSVLVVLLRCGGCHMELLKVRINGRDGNSNRHSLPPSLPPCFPCRMNTSTLGSCSIMMCSVPLETPCCCLWVLVLGSRSSSQLISFFCSPVLGSCAPQTGVLSLPPLW